MHWIRLIWFSSLFILFYGVTSFDTLKTLTRFRQMMAVFFIVSIAIAIDYIVFDLLVGMEFYPATQENWSNVLSVLIFTMSEAIGVWRLLRNKNDYMIWVTPALLDLFLKGLIAFGLFDNVTWLVWDSCRAVLLFAFIQYDRCKLFKKVQTILPNRR